MSGDKRCCKCKVWKPYLEYSKDALRKDGFQSQCKECNREYRLANKERIAEKKKEYRENNREKIAEIMREYYQQNKKDIAEKKKIYRKNNKEKIAARMKEYHKEYKREKYQNDPVYRLRHLVSSAIANTLRNNNGSKEGNSTWDALSYTPQQLKEHLEAQFEEGMSWDNYGHDGWHIDHTYPQSLLPYESMDDDNFRLAWDLRNLRPLWAAENISKGNQIIEGAEELLLEIKKDVDKKWEG